MIDNTRINFCIFITVNLLLSHPVFFIAFVTEFFSFSFKKFILWNTYISKQYVSNTYNLENSNQVTIYPTHSLSNRTLYKHRASLRALLYDFLLFLSGVTVIFSFVLGFACFSYCYAVFVDISKHILFNFICLRTS